MPLHSSDNNSSIDASENGSMSLKTRSSGTMREDDCFLGIVASDLDSFSAKYDPSAKIDSNKRSPVIVFPSVDCRRRKLIHALISQRYQSLAHASVGVEPDRRPVAIYRDFLLKVVMPTRFKSIQNETGSLAYSEFAFCLALLEACRDSGEAKRYIEKLYALRLADQRLVSPLLSGTSRLNCIAESAVKVPVSAPATGRQHAIKPGCECYVPRPMRLLLEQQQKKSSSEDKHSYTENSGKLSRSSTAEVISTEMKQKMRLSSKGDGAKSPSTPGVETRRISINKTTPLGGKSTTPRSSNNNLKSAADTTPHQERKSSSIASNSITENNYNNTNGSVTAMRFLGDFIGPSTNVIQLPIDRYSPYRSEPPPLDYETLSHVLEISGFPKEWRGADLQRFLPVATFIHWVDDTRILAVFKSPAEAKAFRAPPEVCLSVEVRPMKSATIESKYKAYRILDDLVSRLRKPQTDTAVVRRVLNHHLRLGLSKPSPPVGTTTTSNGNRTNANNITPVVSPLVSGAPRDT